MDSERIQAAKALVCSVDDCRMGPIVVAHVDPSGDPSGLAIRSDDNQTVPLCEHHAKELEAMGDRDFNRAHSMDLDMAAQVITCRLAEQAALARSEAERVMGGSLAV